MLTLAINPELPLRRILPMNPLVCSRLARWRVHLGGSNRQTCAVLRRSYIPRLLVCNCLHHDFSSSYCCAWTCSRRCRGSRHHGCRVLHYCGSYTDVRWVFIPSWSQCTPANFRRMAYPRAKRATRERGVYIAAISASREQRLTAGIHPDRVGQTTKFFNNLLGR